MRYYVFQNYLFFLLHVVIQVNYGILTESEAGKTATFSSIEHRSKCTVEKCTCADVPQWNEVTCDHDKSSFPSLHIISFHLPERMFVGLRVYHVWLWNPDTTVADNVLEGILGLEAFLVNRSSIQVIYIISLKIYLISYKIYLISYKVYLVSY